jgi:hypothetical protein
MKDSNIGQLGLDSLRINGSKIDNLPLGQGEKAKEGLVDFIKTDKENKEKAIRAKYPTQSVEYLQSAIKEAEINIQKIKSFKKELRGKIGTYRQLIKDVDFREKELAKYSRDNPEDVPKIKELNKRFPPYNVEALQTQIGQFEEGIERCDEVIEKDYDSISEIRGVLALVEQRDRELRMIK